MDAVQQANSGHPGMPMGMADIAEVLWNDFLIHNPSNPNWSNRDRFVLSNGHGCMLLYAALHLSGYQLTIDDIKQFRQWGSNTPGHPEYGLTPGVETTTGPLGQGLATAVGMAVAEQTLASQFNRSDFPIVDHHTYVFVGDGCLMEGLSHEACSLAGTLKLGKLIVLYDDNGISIDGKTDAWFTDDTAQRFAAYQWQVIDNIDGHDAKAVAEAIKTAKACSDKPSVSVFKTTIYFSSPNLAGSHKSHGAPLGEEEIAKARQQLNWPHAAFSIPSDIYAAWDHREAGAAKEAAWQELFSAYSKAFPELAEEFQRRQSGQLPTEFATSFEQLIESLQKDPKPPATRKASLSVLNHLGSELPELIGGSADLSGSNLTYHQASKAISAEDMSGNYLYYGVREFAMCAMMNGLALHGGFIPYGGTFLVFSDYARNAIRLAALMEKRSIFVLTHDSIGLGEDGPTHQPIEHANMLRMTPNLAVWRPCDATETAVAWQVALESQHNPSALLLSRQNLPHQDRDQKALALIARGGYILRDCNQAPELILMATGSEIAPAVEAYEALTKQGIAVRVVSMPCAERFAEQDESYQESVLPSSCEKRIAIEAGATAFWYRYVGLNGTVIGLDRFGASAKAETLFEQFGFSAKNIITVAQQLLAK